MYLFFSDACFSIVPAFLAFTALVLSVVGNIWCETIVFHPTAAFPDLPTLNFGVWLQQKVSYAVVNGQIYVGDTCVDYYSSTDIDSKWKVTRAFAVIAPVFGIIAICLLFPSCRGDGGGTTSKIGGVVLLLTSLFQGLTLLILGSNACDASNVILVYTSYEQVCSFGWGTKLNISACVLFFVAGALMMAGAKREGTSGGDSKPDEPEPES